MSDPSSSLPRAAQVRAEADRIADRLRAFVRSMVTGGCRLLSQGEHCDCPLCEVDRLHELVVLTLQSREQEVSELKQQLEQVTRERDEAIGGEVFDALVIDALLKDESQDESREQAQEPEQKEP